jgi:hypothetical protein
VGLILVPRLSQLSRLSKTLTTFTTFENYFQNPSSLKILLDKKVTKSYKILIDAKISIYHIDTNIPKNGNNPGPGSTDGGYKISNSDITGPLLPA